MIDTPDHKNIKLKSSPQATDKMISKILPGLPINTPMTPAANQATPILAKNSAIKRLYRACFPHWCYYTMGVEKAQQRSLRLVPVGLREVGVPLEFGC